MLRQAGVAVNYSVFNKAIRLSMMFSLQAWLGIFGLSWQSSTNAQIIGDESLGNEASKLIPNVDIKGLPANRIDGGATRGANLFHSFREFNIDNSQRVYFSNPTGVENILTRVTGGKISNILGTLGVNGSANLFLINPSGIVFGENARLDVGGSFVGSTANSFVFRDGLEFSATNPQSLPLLTINVPIGLQFGGNPGTILVQGNGQGLRENDKPAIDTNDALRIASNQTLALAGGNLILEGATLKTAGGRIELGSMGDVGTVSLNPVENGFALGYDSVSNFGDIQFSKAASVDASGNNGGDIQIRGRQITVLGGSQIEATTLETASGGKLQIFASESLELSGSTADNPQNNRRGSNSSGNNSRNNGVRRRPSSLSIDNRKSGTIPGELAINTKQLIVRNGARISASNSLDGMGGNINVNASESIELIGTGRSSGGLRSSGLSVQTRGGGKAGNLTINTKRLLIEDGAEASASTFAAGNGGEIEVNASETVLLQGTSSNGELRSRLVAEVGDLKDISSDDDSNASIPATGRGGNLTIETKLLNVRDGAAVTVGSKSDDIDAQGAGNIEITAEKIELNNRGAIEANTVSGEGGNISLKLKDILLLRKNSQISTSAGNNQFGGDGGNISINSPFIVALPQENSDIEANAFSGRGGRVDITTKGIFGIRSQPELTNFSDITASSDLGVDGEIFIDNPDVNPSKGVEELPADVVNAAGLINQNLCTAARRGSEFVITGRGGLPASPHNVENANSTWEDWSIALEEEVSKPKPVRRNHRSPKKSELNTPIVEAQGWVFDSNGDVIFTAFPVKVTSKGTWLHPNDCQRLRKAS